MQARTNGDQKLPAINPEDSMVVGIPNSTHLIPDFEAIIEEVDNTINVEHSIPNSTGERKETREAQGLFVEKRKEEAREAQGLCMEIKKEEALISGKEGKSKDNMSGLYGDMEGEFVIGWAEPNGKNKEGKQGRGKKAKGELGENATTIGPSTSPSCKKGI